MHVFCHAVPGTWHAMGVMLSAAGLVRAGCATCSARRSATLDAEAERWAPGHGGAAVRAVPRGRADAARRPRRARRLRRPVAPPRPRRARARGARGRRLRPARLARAAARARRPARGRPRSPAAARAASSGRGSSPRCSTCRSSAPRPTRARRSAPRCSRASATACSPTPPRRSRAASASSDRDRARPRVGRGLRARLRPLPRALSGTETSGGRMSTRRQDGSDHRREPRHRRRGRAHAARSAACKLGLASRSGDDLGLDGVVAQPCDVRDLGAARRASATRPPSASAASTSSSRTRASAPTAPFLDLSQEHLDEMIDVNLKGTLYAVRAALPHMLGREGDVITLASEAGRRGPAARGGLLRLEVRPGRLHARARPRAARARHPLHERLPGRRRDRLRARRRPRPHARGAAAG